MRVINKVLVRIIFFAFVVLLLSKGSISAQKDTLSILHITDMHTMFNLGSYDKDIVKHREDTRGYKNANLNLSQFMQNIPQTNASDFVVATGDLVDFFDAKTPEGKYLEYQVEQFAQFLEDFHSSVYLTLGNHDIFSFNWGENKVVPNQLLSGRARAAWIRNFDCFRNGTYYSHTYQIGKTNYRFIFLDNSFYQFPKDDNTSVPYIDKSQFYWLNAQLNESEDDVEIVFMHIPFFEKVDTTNELYSTLIQHASCKLVFAGHHHKNQIHKYLSGDDGRLFQVQTGALVSDDKNWRLIRLTENNIVVSLPGKTENELVIPIN